MRALDVTATLAAFERRGPGTDAEWRAARRLERELRAEGHKVRLEPFWCRPNWALAHAWHVALALAGSLVSVSHPTIGAVLLGIALTSVIADGLTGVSLGRRLTPERASQNVVVQPERASQNLVAEPERASQNLVAEPERASQNVVAVPERSAPHDPTTLIVTANYDVPRAALVYRPALRRLAAWLRRTSGPLALGWLAWLAIAMAWALVVAIIRATGHHSSHILGPIQLPPTVALVLAMALLLEAAGAGYDPGTELTGSGAATAVAIADALRATPRRNLIVELLLQGAGEAQEIGMRRYLRAHKRTLRPGNVIVLGVSASGAGPPRWWRSDGRLLPLAYTRRLRELAENAAREHPRLTANEHRQRGGTPALPARAKRLPAITIGNVDTAGKVDTAGNVDTARGDALDRVQEFALRLIDAIDAALEPQPENSEPAPTPA